MGFVDFLVKRRVSNAMLAFQKQLATVSDFSNINDFCFVGKTFDSLARSKGFELVIVK